MKSREVHLRQYYALKNVWNVFWLPCKVGKNISFLLLWKLSWGSFIPIYLILVASVFSLGVKAKTMKEWTNIACLILEDTKNMKESRIAKSFADQIHKRILALHC